MQINGRTPEAIKKALACNSKGESWVECAGCMYERTERCSKAVSRDALAYTKYLEERAARLEQVLLTMGVTVRNCMPTGRVH